jgi:hypothetical protein
MRILGTTLVAATLLVGAGTARADIQHGHTSSCEVQQGELGAAYAAYLVNGNTESDLRVTCPVQFKSSGLGPATVDPVAARLDYYDINSGTTVSDGVISCNAFLNKANGTIVTLGNKYSCETAGGCTTTGSTFQGGAGYLQWSDTLGATPDVVGMGFTCVLPKRLPNLWFGGAIMGYAFSFTAN